ncbi:hypothetical protein VZ95_13690, partial [Elstera litoralis]
MTVDPVAARALAARLQTIAATGLNDGDIALYAAQSLATPAAHAAVRAALATLAADIGGDQPGSDDLLAL